MSRFRIIPYRSYSQSARQLSEELGGRRVRLENSNYRPRHTDIVINWGNTNPPILPRNALGLYNFQYLNEAGDVARASNKLWFFELMAFNDFENNFGNEEVTPPFWVNSEDIPEDAYPVVCRTVLNGHSGNGIVIANSPDELVDAPLYVKYIKKSEEYRIHYGCDANSEITIISVQQKRRRLDVPDEEVNWKVRNHHNGFIYAREGVEPPADVIRKARQAFAATALDFGAVDVIWNHHYERAYVLEINTAPGLEGQTLQDYANFFRTFSTVEE